jgi:hypothetical protein
LTIINEVIPLDDKPPGPTLEGDEDFAEPECVAVALRCFKLLDSRHCFAACHGLGVARTRREDHAPEPPGLDAVAALLGQDGEVSQGEMAIDALINTAKLVGTLEGQDPPPAGFGLCRLAGLAVEDGFAEMQLGVVGVKP